jgi:hypothetical protein
MTALVKQCGIQYPRCPSSGLWWDPDQRVRLSLRAKFLRSGEAVLRYDTLLRGNLMRLTSWFAC